MKVDRTPFILTQDPVSLSDLVTPFETLRLYKDGGLISADNFVDDSEFDSSYIKDVADSPTYSKYFVGQYFDNESGGEADNIHFAYNSIVELITDEILISSIEYQVIIKKDGYEIKSSDSTFLASVAGAALLSIPTGGLSWLAMGVPGGREILKDVSRYVRKPIDKATHALENAVDWVFGRKKRKRRPNVKAEYSTKETIIVPLPFGFRFVKASFSGGIYADLTDKNGKVFVDTIYSGDDVVVFAPQIILSTKLADGEVYVHQGHIQILMEAKV